MLGWTDPELPLYARRLSERRGGGMRPVTLNTAISEALGITERTVRRDW
jgi:NADH/NAD ratio-sensing transcriptional regulator Rex